VEEDGNGISVLNAALHLRFAIFPNIYGYFSMHTNKVQFTNNEINGKF
jgi:hypothetical protein